MNDFIFTQFILYSIDMFFTILLLRYYRDIKKDKQYYKKELNYHRLFFKKFGLEKGALLSFTIGLLVLGIVSEIFNNYFTEYNYMIIGMLLVPAYSNILNYVYLVKDGYSKTKE